ncbi:pulmonary surfactant-associated protein B [Anolis carolinensis]|uniref:pulmonary surfactant-associated protein B n=1 Tax=Anolis carolinensis TaxID=28377 RepID=UPI000462E3EB|nr:PREDICTED: pulmonary surfactant-associated protein B [Anolis carolinensis]|eukprot:XP_008123097.1 PREDICTED: pulmonary surfactant-associated protein B [Anolis carolinensis]
MWQLLLLGLFSCGSAAAAWTSVEEGCAQGPVFWCRNLVTAIQCGALGHCMKSRWDPNTKEDLCADCKQVVSILVRMGKESALKVIQKSLEDECKDLPLQTLAPQCQALVDTYFAQFIGILEKQMAPGAVCAKLSLCPPDRSAGKEDALEALFAEIRGLLPPQKDRSLSWPHSQTQGVPEEGFPIPLPTCWLCRSFVGRAEALIPTAAIGTTMAQLCRVLPVSMGGMCQCLTEKYSATILDMVLGKVGPNLICGMMLMCATEDGSPDMPPAAPALDLSTDGCQACLAISSHVQGALQPNSTRVDVDLALLSACSRSFLGWEECKRFISQHQAQLFALLLKPWGSHAICQELGACAAEKPFPGATACAQGPPFWCSSWDAAKQCQAVQYCQAHAWL